MTGTNGDIWFPKSFNYFSSFLYDNNSKSKTDYRKIILHIYIKDPFKPLKHCYN